MEKGKKKGITKRALRTKLILLIILAVIMVPLIILYKSVGDTTPKIKLYNRNEASDTAEEETTGEAASLAEPVTDEPQTTEPQTQAPATKAPKKDKTIVSVTDPENWSIAIINTEYPLPDSYAPTLSNAIDGSDIQLDSKVSEHYAAMYAAAKQAGCVLTPYSGYHTYTLQENTYKRKVNFYVNQGMSDEEAAAKARQQVLPAGCSEHNAGLSMDIVSASSDFVNTKEYKWLCENAQNYGFILRYPEDKTAITGVNFEPWHWRYVGEKAAKEMKENNQCLEEYLGLA